MLLIDTIAIALIASTTIGFAYSVTPLSSLSKNHGEKKAGILVARLADTSIGARAFTRSQIH